MRRSVPLLVILSIGACQRSDRPDRDPSVDRLARVTASLTPVVLVKGAPPVHYALADRMAHFRTPGVSVAVADSGRIVWARGFGAKEAGTSDSITPTTLFEAGSISKPVAATGTLRLVEQGTLALDENVNAYLKSWKVPDNEFTTKEKVTLRRLLSHSAGLTVHGFPGYRVTDSIPTVPEILDGRKPANTAPVRVDTVPGSRWRYSGGGTTVQQLVLTDVTGKPFPALLEELVFRPIGMTNSTYEQPLPARLHASASAAHHADGAMVPGRWHVYPEMAAAGLWTTPTDLLKWAIAIAAAREGKSQILSQKMATEMLTVQMGSVGLGPFVEGSGRAFRFGHGGADEGFHAELVYFPETGQGAAVMVNGDGGTPMIRELLYAIAVEYGWPEFEPRQIEVVSVDSLMLERVAGTYRIERPIPVTATVTREGSKLFLTAPPISRKTEVVFISPTRAVALDGGNEFDVIREGQGRATGLRFGPFVLKRIDGQAGTRTDREGNR